VDMWPAEMSWDDGSAWVCVTHQRFVPCRSDEPHDYTNDPGAVDRVRRYQTGESVMDSDPTVNPQGEQVAVSSSQQDHSDPDSVRGVHADAPTDTGKLPRDSGPEDAPPEEGER